MRRCLWYNKFVGKWKHFGQVLYRCDSPLSLSLVFYALVLADGFAVFHGHFGLVGTHFFAVPKIAETNTIPVCDFRIHRALLTKSNTSLSPFVDELELHGLLFLNGGQEFLEVFTLLCDVAVLHLLLLVAVAVDQLWPLFCVLCCDVLYLHTQVTCTLLSCMMLIKNVIRLLNTLMTTWLVTTNDTAFNFNVSFWGSAAVYLLLLLDITPFALADAFRVLPGGLSFNISVSHYGI